MLHSDGRLLKSVLEKYSIAFTSTVAEHDLNHILLYLSEIPSADKHVAYRVFDAEWVDVKLDFVQWAKEYTKNIDKDFNKGRKITRLFDKVYQNYADILPYTLKAKEVYDLFISILLVDLETLVMHSPVTDSAGVTYINPYALFDTREYMCNVFKIVLLSVQNIEFDEIIAEFVVQDNDFHALGNIIENKVLHVDTEGY